ncbi:MAG TPA: FtsX-like permease family protein [Streptosporangiaceae bacterium]|nr:FtsX-like permease family protein [Streptosporangiaceae bacterium]
MLNTILAGLRYRKARLLFSSVAIALGVAFVAGTLLLNASMSASYYAGFAVGAKNVSALVASPKSGNPPGDYGGQTVPVRLLQAVRATRGVAAADGRVIGPAAILGADGKVTGNGYGVNVTSDPALSGFTLVTGQLPAAADQVDVDKSTAADQHFRLGQAVRVVTGIGATQVFYLAGTIDLGVNPQIGDAAVLAFQTPQAFRVTGQSGYAMIVARAAPGVSQSALAAALSARMRPLEVQTGAMYASEEATAASHVGDVFGYGLLVFAGISLVVACIVIYNTFGILIAQRSREFALLRCVGASRRQVFRAMIAEAAATGLAAAATGIVLGIALSAGMLRLVKTSPPLVLQPSALLIAACTGLVVTVGAALVPARAATRIAPVAAAAGAGTETLTRRAGRIGFAAVIGALGLLLTAFGMGARMPAGMLVIAAGGCVFFLAVLAIGPLFTPPMISLLAWLPRKALTRHAATLSLATANARRNPHRVAATTAALTIGITLMTLFTVVFSSIQASADDAIAGHFPFDFIVSANGFQKVPPSAVAAVRRAPGLSVVAAEYEQLATVGSQQDLVGAFDHDALGVAVKPAMLAGSLTAVGPGTAAADSGRVGRVITVITPDAGRLRLRIVAVYSSQTYHTPIPSVLISSADFVRGFRPTGPDRVVIDAARGVSTGASRAAVAAAIGSDPLLKMTTFADYKSSLDSQVNTILEVVAGLVALAIIIALTGISSTLTLSVIERTRESALLRALGLTGGQLRRMLLSEAVLMGLLAAVLGGALGIGFGAALLAAFRHSGGLGVLSVPIVRLVLYGAAAGLVSAAAAVLPARRAARTSVITPLTS